MPQTLCSVRYTFSKILSKPLAHCIHIGTFSLFGIHLKLWVYTVIWLPCRRFIDSIEPPNPLQSGVLFLLSITHNKQRIQHTTLTFIDSLVGMRYLAMARYFVKRMTLPYILQHNTNVPSPTTKYRSVWHVCRNGHGLGSMAIHFTPHCFRI